MIENWSKLADNELKAQGGFYSQENSNRLMMILLFTHHILNKDNYIG